MKRAFLATVLYLFTLPAVAQPQCLGSLPEVLNRLKAEYNEERVGSGITHSGKWFSTLTVAPDGNWSFVLSNEHGVTCIMSGGHGWNFRKSPPKGDPS